MLGRHLSSYLADWLEANPNYVNSSAPKPGTGAAFRQSMRHGDNELDSLKHFLRDVDQPPSRTHFERAMNELVEATAGFSIELVHRVLAGALTDGQRCRFAEREDLYDLLLTELRRGSPYSKVSAISFNYDVLLEEAAARVLAQSDLCSAVDYVGLRQPSAPTSVDARGLRVFKPHGSVNWFDFHSSPGSQMNSDKPMGELSPSGLGIDYGEATVTYVPAGLRQNLVAMLSDKPMRLELAPYGSGKPAGTALINVRAAALRELRASRDACVIIIGLLPPQQGDKEDDPFLFDLFEVIRQHRGPKLFINPSESDCARARLDGLDARQQTFKEFLDSDFFSDGPE